MHLNRSGEKLNLRGWIGTVMVQKSYEVFNCDAVVQSGLLTWEQMLSAACRYCVGATRKGGVIFWQIDHEGRVHDGKVMYYQTDCHRCKDEEPRPRSGAWQH